MKNLFVRFCKSKWSDILSCVLAIVFGILLVFGLAITAWVFFEMPVVIGLFGKYGLYLHVQEMNQLKGED